MVFKPVLRHVRCARRAERLQSPATRVQIGRVPAACAASSPEKHCARVILRLRHPSTRPGHRHSPVKMRGRSIRIGRRTSTCRPLSRRCREPQLGLVSLARCAVGGRVLSATPGACKSDRRPEVRGGQELWSARMAAEQKECLVTGSCQAEEPLEAESEHRCDTGIKLWPPTKPRTKLPCRAVLFTGRGGSEGGGKGRGVASSASLIDAAQGKATP
ncbi:hypothetical protein MRX96_019080 [Rhipicephalus microplus]